MIITKTELEGVVVIEPQRFFDERGYFCETFNKTHWENCCGGLLYVQDNESKSKKNVIRGLHFQKPPFQQAKLIRVISGAVLDVVVDIRLSSSTYGKHFKIILSHENNKQLFVPEGFAHGFLSLENNTILNYKCTQYYNKESECSILWSDKDLNIDWTISSPVVSDKDNKAVLFNNFSSPFK